MMDALLQRTRLIATMVLLLSFVGLGSWLTMPRQEDPSFAERFGTVVVPYPGGSALDVERLVLDPIFDRLNTLPELRDVAATARPGVGVFQIRLQESIAPSETDAVWEDVRIALDEAQAHLPVEAHEPMLDNQIGDPATAVFLVTGDADVLTLRRAAKRLEDRLETVDGVERVTLLGDPGIRAEVAVSTDSLRRVGLTAPALARQLEEQNITVPGGSLAVDGRSVVLRHRGEITDVEGISATPISLPSGAMVPLGSIAVVTLTPDVPDTSRVYHDRQLAVGVSVIPEPEQDLVALGEAIRDAVTSIEPELAPLSVETFAFQPDNVRARIFDLSASLLLGVFIVAGVVFVAMGPRMGMVVSAIVPLVALSTVGIYAIGGGVLHQISIAAIVLALGLLVDNAIVVAESVQQHLDAGHPDPARAAVRELAVPLGTATGTTVAAFVPMLLSQGGTADFTRTIPLLVIVSLALSYVYALVVTPSLARAALKPAPHSGGRLESFGARLGALAIGRPRTVLGTLALAMALVGALATQVPSEFFPMSERDRAMVTLTLPEGTHPATTQARVQAWAEGVEPWVDRMTLFVGGGLPRFYYNLNDAPNSPHRAEVVIDAPRHELDGILARIDAHTQAFPEIDAVGKRLQQGPPVGAPVQVRLRGHSLVSLAAAAETATRALSEVPGARDVRNDLGNGIPTVELTPRDAWVARVGTGRTAVSLATLGQTLGLPAGAIRNGTDPIDIEVTTPAGESTAPERLTTLPVATASGPVPLGQLATSSLVWQPAAVHHRDGVREVTVSAELAPGFVFTEVIEGFQSLELDLGDVEVSFGGAAEGSGQANDALLRTLPLGLGLLVFFLLLEFDSFRRLAIILSTVPLAAAGVVPGLALTGQPFGFMSVLGVVALVGIVVNNAIVLLNRVEARRSEGASIEEALHDAIRNRIRPILLTTVTTVAGMLPLAFSGSALWPPLASAMISGLLASTLLTLVAVPALYRVLFRDGTRQRRSFLLLGLFFPTVATAAPLSLEAAMDLAETAPVVLAAEDRAHAARWQRDALWLDAAAPVVSAGGERRWRDEAIAIDTPIGPFVQQPKAVSQVGVRLEQPLLNVSGWARARAAGAGASAEVHRAERTREEFRRAIADAYLDLVLLEAEQAALVEHGKALAEATKSARALFDEGLAVKADVLRLEVQSSDLVLQQASLEDVRLAASAKLGAALGTEPVDIESPGDITVAPSTRPELAASQFAIESAGAQRAAWAASVLPSVTAEVGWQGTDNETLVKSSWTEVALKAEWQLGLGRIGRVAEASARRRAAVREYDALRAEIEAERDAARRNVQTRIAAVAVREAAVQQAEESARIVRARYAEGEVAVSEVLNTEATLATARSNAVRAHVEKLRAQIHLSTAGG